MRIKLSIDAIRYLWLILNHNMFVFIVIFQRFMYYEFFVIFKNNKQFMVDNIFDAQKLIVRGFCGAWKVLFHAIKIDWGESWTS